MRFEADQALGGHCQCATECCPIRALVFRVVGDWRCEPGAKQFIRRVSLEVPNINEERHIATITAAEPKEGYPTGVDVRFDKGTPPEHRETHLRAGIDRLFRPLQPA